MFNLSTGLPRSYCFARIP